MNSGRLTIADTGVRARSAAKNIGQKDCAIYSIAKTLSRRDTKFTDLRIQIWEFLYLFEIKIALRVERSYGPCAVSPLSYRAV